MYDDIFNRQRVDDKFGVHVKSFQYTNIIRGCVWVREKPIAEKKNPY